VIIWLNGTFGVGKTTTAAALNGQLPGWRLFDPETVGLMLRGALADHPVSDFQHWPQALRRRIESSQEARGWRLDHLERYASSRASLRARADLIIDTDSRAPDAVAAEIGRVAQGVRSA
jgi:hypothetical protein